ncbi:NAD(P)/FAD-dependent oxidoreductase [Pararhizobium sp. O133]|uniref:NAD(P)/FAD-dependent oxidoreductase n=1 Tax=Pararhizobium sp. O133 TaxID=3449278 RepID=UPI003F687137
MKTTPFWWEEAEPAHGERQFDTNTCSILIVGAGYSGLSAAITLAEAGVKDVFVIDSQRIGEGASSRNGGQIGNGAKFSLAEATRRFGAKRAAEILEDYDRSMDFMLERASTLKDPFDLNMCGSVAGAHSRKDLEGLVAYRNGLSAEKQKRVDILPEGEVHRVLKTHIYRGAMVSHHTGSIHPAKYVRALANRARELGVRIFTGYRYQGVSTIAGRYHALVEDVTDRNTITISSDKVLIGANGYVGPEIPWLRKRTIPIQSYMIATEQLPLDQMEELIPGNRVVGDTKHILYYFRRSPDGTRILFGGRAKFRTSTAEESAVGLRDFMLHTFPSLERAKITHSWFGNVCFAYDFCSHVGRMPDGTYYTSCCNGGGISMMTYLGHRSAEMLLGMPGHDRGVVNSHFPRLYFYNGHPWFLPMVGTYYRFLDRAARWRD